MSRIGMGPRLGAAVQRAVCDRQGLLCKFLNFLNPVFVVSGFVGHRCCELAHPFDAFVGSALLASSLLQARLEDTSAALQLESDGFDSVGDDGWVVLAH